MDSRKSPTPTTEDFDPIAYIEQAFTEGGKPVSAVPAEDLELEIPSIQEFLTKSEKSNGVKSKAKSTVKSGPKATRRSTGKLSAPRPRKVRSAKPMRTTLDPAISETWTNLPRNISFLSSFFDDKVTSNYYRGEFKESRQELIRRLLDPELSLEEVSRLLGVCPATVRRYTNRGWLEHHRTKGGQRRFRLTGVAKFVENHGRILEE